jgi:hypothetical protein
MYKRRAKISPHQSCQPNLNHFTNVKWITRWEGRDGITLHRFPACRCWELDQLFIRRHSNTDLKWTKLFFGPIKTRPETFLGFLEKTTMKTDTKLTVVMCCHIFERRSVAPSSSDFRRKPRAPRRIWCDKSPNVWRCGITHFVWSETVMS